MYLPNWGGKRDRAQKKTMCAAYVPDYATMPFRFMCIQNMQFISVFMYYLMFYYLGGK